MKKCKDIKQWISKRSGGTIDVQNTTKEKQNELKKWLDTYAISCDSMEANMDTNDEELTDENANISTPMLPQKRELQTNSDTVWHKRMRMTKYNLQQKRRLNSIQRPKKRMKTTNDERLVTILPLLIYSQSYFSFSNKSSVGS